MKKIILATMATVLMSSFAQAQIANVGFICQYKTSSGKSIEVAGFTTAVKKLPKKYDGIIWSGQVVAMQDGGKNLIFDLIKFREGSSGFAGRNIEILAEGNGQSIQMKLVTGSSSGVIGTLAVKKGTKVLTSGNTQCKLLSKEEVGDTQEADDNIWE